MRKTKIICTIGPASDSKEIFTQLVKNGLNVARLNFSHGDYEEQGRRINMIKGVREQLGIPVAILLDTKGPEIRIRQFESGVIDLKEGQSFILTTDDVIGNEKICSITYKKLPEDISVGNKILIDDGLIELEVEEVINKNIRCKVLNSGTIKDKKGVNVPGVKLHLPAITEKDCKDIEFGIEKGIDFIAASFIRKAEDIIAIRKILNKNDANHIQIIAKIENKEGIDNLDEIIEVADGIMVARGDLGVETPAASIPVYQKRIIAKCNEAGKSVITATQMLDSMMRNPRPTRAEITDVANAIFDGTDAIMLSGETAAGKYPVESLKTMVAITQTTEQELDYELYLKRKQQVKDTSITNAVSYSTCTTAHNLGAAAIISTTSSGFTARRVSKFRPKVPIIAATISKKIQRQLLLLWGVIPILIERTETTDALFKTAVNEAKQKGYIKDGDLVVFTAGLPLGMSGATNLMKIQTVGEIWLKGVGIGSGTAYSNVCIIKDALDFKSKFKEGDIIAAKDYDKVIVPYLNKASALILENGQSISSSIVKIALDYGIPVIVGVEDVLQQLNDGQKVTVDVKRGLVYTGKQ